MRPLRFCMVSTFYPPYSYGGDGITVQRLCRALVRAGHEVTVVHDADAFRTLGHATAAATPSPEDGVRVVTLSSSLGALSVMLTHQLGRPVVHRRRLAALFDQGRFDVVHFHNASLVGGPGLFGLARNAATMYTAHEHWLVCPTHVLWRHGREPCTGRECLRCTLRSGRPPQWWRHSAFFERSLGAIDVFIALSEFSRRKHREFGFSRDMEVLPPLVLDEDRDTADAHAPSPHARPYFFFAGRLERIKGLDDVIPLFSRPDAVADLVIAGTGSHEAELERLAGGSSRVHFLGHLPAGQLGPWYRHAIAHVAPSVCFETFGNTLVESFRQGTPVVARRIGPFPEIVAAARAGILFDSADSLSAALARLANGPGERNELGASGRRAFELTWSEAAILPRYLELVERTRSLRGRATSPAPVPVGVS